MTRIARSKIGGLSLRHAWMVLWADWTTLSAIGVAFLIYRNGQNTVHAWSEFAMAALVVLAGPVVALRLYSRGMNAIVAFLFCVFTIVGLAACALMFAKLSVS